MTFSFRYPFGDRYQCSGNRRIMCLAAAHTAGKVKNRSNEEKTIIGSYTLDIN